MPNKRAGVPTGTMTARAVLLAVALLPSGCAGWQATSMEDPPPPKREFAHLIVDIGRYYTERDAKMVSPR